jgi:hypothetical protein
MTVSHQVGDDTGEDLTAVPLDLVLPAASNSAGGMPSRER